MTGSLVEAGEAVHYSSLVSFLAAFSCPAAISAAFLSSAASVAALALSSAFLASLASYFSVTSLTELLLLAIASCPTVAFLITAFLVFSESLSGIGFSSPSFFAGCGIASGALVVSILVPALLTAS